RLTHVIKSIGAVICERDPARARERDTQLVNAAQGAIRTTPRQDLIPPLSEGYLSPQPHSANGTLFPQPVVVSGQEHARLDDLTGAGFRVVLHDHFLHEGLELGRRPRSPEVTLVR